MSHFKIFLLCLSSIILTTNSAKILGIVPIPSYSHQITFRPIWKELSLRGHQVTVITTNPMNDSSLVNLTEIDISKLYHVMKDFKYSEKLVEYKNNMFKLLEFFISVSEITNDVILLHPDVQNLIHNQSVRFDLVMIQYLNAGMYPFVHRFNAPFIGLSSLDASTKGHECMGNPTHPTLNPEPFMPFETDLTFLQRIISAMSSAVMTFYNRGILAKFDGINEKYFGKGYPPLSELVCRLDLLFVNVNPVFNVIRPMVPGTITIGGGLHIGEVKSLPEALQTYLDSAKEGVIYFSLGGTNVQSASIPESLRKVILETFGELPYKVLWKFEADDLPGKPDNVKIEKWLPQQDLLRHPNVKLFITQGGIQSFEEAVYSHVPMIGMPFFGDQQNNVKRMVRKGIGLEVDRNNLDKETFKKAILEVMENPKYRNRVKELAELSLDQPMTGLEKAVWWTEYVLRHKGAQHLKGPAAKLPTYQYFLLDVIGFLAAILLVVSYVTYKVVKISYGLIKGLVCKAIGCKSKVNKAKVKRN